jgi:hypothetical protein
MNKPYKKYFRQQEELTSASIPQSVRPEKVAKVVKVGNIAKDTEEGCEESVYDFWTEEDDETIEEDFLRNKDYKDEILDTNFRDVEKNKLVNKKYKEAHISKFKSPNLDTNFTKDRR